jgi:iron complex outermembrane receptor protein
MRLVRLIHYPPHTYMLTLTQLPRTLSGLLRAAALGSLLFLCARAEEAKKSYNLPAGDAASTLKLYSEISGRETLFAAEVVRGVQTKAVKGELEAQQAITTMLEGTGLVAVSDKASGALAIRRITDPNGSRAALDLASDRPSQRSLSDAPGEIRGQVSNSVTGSNLENVRIRVRETGREYSTERGGNFIISGLPAGTYTLSFEYPGLDLKTEVVEVNGRQVANLSVALGSDIYVMPRLVVAGQREGNAAAIAEQRRAPNITNMITADTFGGIAKANVANLLKRIPGVTGITDDEIDTSVIQVRGMDASLTTVDLDGTPAAAPFEANSRKQNLNSLPVDLIDRVEVIKAPTPADDADSLGGRVKLTTKSAFDRNERAIDVRLGGSYNETYGKSITVDRKNYIPFSAGLTYSDVVGLFGKPRALGIILMANYDKFLDARRLSQFGHVTPSGGSPSATTTKDYSTFGFTSAELHKQERKGGSLRLDYKLADHTTIGMSLLYSSYFNGFDRVRSGVNGGTIDTVLSDPDPNFTVVNNATALTQRNDRPNETDTYNVRFFGKSELAGFKFTYDFNLQQARQFEITRTTDVISNRRFSYSLDWRPNPAYPYPVVRSGLDPFTDLYEDTASTSLSYRRQNLDRDNLGARLDVEKPLEWKWPVNLKAGLRLRDETQKNERERLVAALATGVGKNLSAYLDPTWKVSGNPDVYPVGAAINNDKIYESVKYVGGADPRTAWTYDPNIITLNATNTVSNSLLTDLKMQEKIYAAYLEGSIKIGRLTALGGARAERTDLFLNYPVRNRAATDLLAQYNGRTRGEARYDDVFPSMHLKYQLTDALQARASVSTTIGRPSIGNLTANSDINLTSRQISVPNPELQPQRSINYDLSLEYYFKRVGVLSVGVFQKDIRDYIRSVSTTISEAAAAELGAPLTNPSPDVLSWTLSTDDNNGKARVRGLEFNYSQQLDFLPGALRGLGVFANYTWLQSEGAGQIIGGVPAVVPLVNFVPRSGNAGLSYTYGRWDARLQVNYHSDYLDGYNATNPTLRNSTRGARTQWDFNGRCNLTSKLSVFANLSNFTSSNEPDYNGGVAPERRDQTIGYSFIITGGINAKF